MPLLPALINDLIEDLNNINRSSRFTLGDLYDQHFGLGLGDLPISRISPNLSALRSGYHRPWRNLAPPSSGVSSIRVEGHDFTVRLDVSHFKPEELKVHVDDGGYVVVEGKHDERVDEHGLIARQFTRRYKLPESVNIDTLASSLSTDGVLTISAAKKAPADALGRPIKIVQTNQPASQTQTSSVETKTTTTTTTSTEDQTSDDQSTD